ncbi:MAG: hydrogenase iron-sulfur subunit [Promethearchaeota archaeon]
MIARKECGPDNETASFGVLSSTGSSWLLRAPPELVRLKGDTTMNIYAALAHPLREKILKLLDSDRLVPYKTLLSRLGLDETGLLNYHLKKLDGFVEKHHGLYRLTAAGQNAVRLMSTKDQLMTGRPTEAHITETIDRVHRIGVILCSCGSEIDRAIDTTALIEKVSELPTVMAKRIFPFLCMLDNVEKIKSWCGKHFLNGLVVAACSPRLHHDLFSKICEQLEMPVEFANIREHCSWVHRRNPESATEKALLLIAASVAKLHHYVHATRRVVPIRKSVAIIGGGIAGLIAANVLSKSPLEVILIESAPCLGGTARHWERIHGSVDCSPCMISELVSSVMLAGNVRIFTESELASITGEAGNYEVTAIQSPRYVDLTRCTMCGECTMACPETRPNKFELGIGQHRIIHLPCPFAYPHKPVIEVDDIEFCKSCRDCLEACPSHAIDLDQESKIVKFTVGGTILATGAVLPNAEDLTSSHPLSYDPYNDVVSSYEFERMLAPDGPTQGRILRVSDGKPVKSLIILQCVGSETVCSGYCCNVAHKYMGLIDDMDDEISVKVLYERSRLPHAHTGIIPEDERVHVCNVLQSYMRKRHHVIKTDVGDFSGDLIVLNMGMTPDERMTKLQAEIGFNLKSGGFVDARSLPTGVWACGAVTGPKPYPQLESEAQLAALEALLFLGRDSFETGELTVIVDQDKCGVCGLCVEACPHNAIALVENTIRIDSFGCRNCGVCAVVCHTGAITASSVQDEMRAAISALSKGKKSPKILVLCCESCGYPAVDNAGARRYEYDAGSYLLSVPCTVSIDADLLITSLQAGFDGITLIGCHETACRHLDGIQVATKRIEALIEFLGPELQNRVRVLKVSALEGHIVADHINQFAEDLRGATET